MMIKWTELKNPITEHPDYAIDKDCLLMDDEGQVFVGYFDTSDELWWFYYPPEKTYYVLKEPPIKFSFCLE
jgi:hypothetical protein